MNDASLSLEARGLYALLAASQGQPVDPYRDRVEDASVITDAIEELIVAGLAVRVSQDDPGGRDEDDDASPFSDRLIRVVSSRYPPFSEITPAEFEAFVSDLLLAAGGRAHSFSVEMHTVLAGVDGQYDFDAVATYEVLGLKHTLLVEAKRHKNPIKRELVQALHAKLQSVGAQKALMIAATRYQPGAVRYALIHGIALATVSEGRFLLETRSEGDVPILTALQATELGLEPIAAMGYHQVPGSSTLRGFRLSPQHGDSLLEWIAGP